MTDDVLWLSFDEAARTTSVPAATIREWCVAGRIDVERRGELRVVRLDQVRDCALGAKRLTEMDRTTLRKLLGNDAPRAELIHIADLQQQIRGRHQTTRRPFRRSTPATVAAAQDGGGWAG